MLSPFGMNDKPLVTGRIQVEQDRPLPRPYVLLQYVQHALAAALRSQQLFSVGENLSFIVNRRGAGRYVIGIQNNALEACPFEIVSHCGEIRRVEALSIDDDDAVRSHPGYWPTGMAGHDGGASDETTIAGGDVRIFAVDVAEAGVETLAHCPPPDRVKDRGLALRDVADLRQAILTRPTFFRHFDTVKIDWTYLRMRDPRCVEAERDWLERQQLCMFVDFTPGLNHYPDLTLLDAHHGRYAESIAAVDDVFAKMERLGSRDAVFRLNRVAENRCDHARAHALFRKGMADVCRRAAGRGITVHLQHRGGSYSCFAGAAELLGFMDEVAHEALRFSLSLSHALLCAEDPRALLRLAGTRLGSVLLSLPRCDEFGQTYDAHLPICRGHADVDLRAFEGLRVPLILNADYGSWDEVYRDVRAVWPARA